MKPQTAQCKKEVNRDSWTRTRIERTRALQVRNSIQRKVNTTPPVEAEEQHYAIEQGPANCEVQLVMSHVLVYLSVMSHVLVHPSVSLL